MRSKKKAENQLSFLAPSLKEQLNPDHELYLLSKKVDWSYFEEEFSVLYSDKGRPAHPIRLMVSLLLLKSIYNLSDEKLVEEHWEMNSYFQYFSGFTQQQWGAPCAASDLVFFRNRIGEDGHDPNVSIDTTVQENNRQMCKESERRRDQFKADLYKDDQAVSERCL